MGEKAIIYHNPRCSKSRCALGILDEKGVDYDVVKYLEASPTKEDLKHILELLKVSPVAIVRKGEKTYKENYKGKELTDEEWLDAMVQHPILIERPIIVKDGKAVVGRPPENVLELL